jgi:hypothetical protein
MIRGKEGLKILTLFTELLHRHTQASKLGNVDYVTIMAHSLSFV